MTHRQGRNPARPPVVQWLGKRFPRPWAAAFAAGAAVVAAVWWGVLTTPGDLQQRDLYPSLVLDRVVEHSVYPLWSPRGTLSIAGTGRLPITLALVGAAKALGLDGATYARLIVLWIAGVGYVSAFAAFALAARWRPSLSRASAACGAMVAGVVFVVNPWTIARLEHSWLLAQWAAAPLVLGCYVEGARSGRRRWTAASALVFALLGAAQPHYLVFTTGMVALWVAVAAARRRGARRRTLADACLWLAVLVPLLAYQIAPYAAVELYGGSPQPAYTLMDQTRTTLSHFQDLPSTLQGAANFVWRGALVPQSAARLPWELAGWVMAAAPLAAALQRRWGPPALHLALGGYLAAAIAAAAAWAPTADLYQTAVNTVPGLWVFREPDRVVGLLVLAQAFGAGFVMADLWQRASAASGLRRAVGPALLAGYVGLAAAVHAIPALPLLWDADRPGYLPRPLPPDYRAVLQAADAAAGPDGRMLIVSSDERRPPWDDTRILRLMEAASLANPSLTGDTRSPVPPAPVAGRWMEFVYGTTPSIAAAAARQAGFSHVVVMRDQPDGERLAAALAARPDVDVLARGPNALALAIGGAAPLLEPRQALWTDRLESSAPDGAAHVLANHRARPALPPTAGLPNPTTDTVFAIADGVTLRSVTDWFGFHGSRGGWTRGGAYADERQAWLKHLKRAGLADWSSDYGLGLAFAALDGERSALVVDASGPPGSAVWLRVFTSPRSSWIDVDTSHGRTRLDTNAPTARWRWTRLGPATNRGVSLRAGPGLEAVSTLAVAPGGWQPAPGPDPTPLVYPRVEVGARGATRIDATAHGADGWAFLVLRRAYDPAWLAWVGGRAFAPVLVDGLWNGYLLPVADGASIGFEYAPQRWYDVGIAISCAAALGIGIGLGAAQSRARAAGRLPEHVRRGAPIEGADHDYG